MNSYSEILDNLSSIKTNEQYVGFNPLSTKRLKVDNAHLVVWLISIITISCLVMIIYTWVESKKDSVLFPEELPLDQSNYTENVIKTEATLFEEKVLEMKSEVDLLIAKSESIIITYNDEIINRSKTH